MKNKKEQSHKSVNKITTSISIIFLILGIFIITTSLNITLKTNKEVLNYQKDADINYKVYLNQDISNNSYLEQDQTYNTNLIDDIVTTFNYNFVANKKFDFNYLYQVKALLTIYNSQNQEIGKKEYVIVPEVKKALTNSNGYQINEVFAINYPKYMDDMKNLMANSEYNDYTGILTLNLNTNINGQYKESNENINEDGQISMTIPIREGTIEITKDLSYSNDESIRGDETSTISNNITIIIGSILLVISIIILAIEGKKAYSLNIKQKKYYQEINNLLKKYNKIMVKAEKLPALSNKRVIEIANITDLIELEKELETGILVYEKVKTNETWFIIIHQNEAWIYIKRL